LFAARREVAEYYKTHPKIDDEQVKSLLASAIAAEPESIERKFYMEALGATARKLDTFALVQEADVAISNKTFRN
jgi:hypothetical protein